jgi:hypothetical protein
MGGNPLRPPLPNKSLKRELCDTAELDVGGAEFVTVSFIFGTPAKVFSFFKG